MPILRMAYAQLVWCVGMASVTGPTAASRRGVLEFVLLTPALALAVLVSRVFGGCWVNWVLPGVIILSASVVWFWSRSSAGGLEWKRAPDPLRCRWLHRSIVGAALVGLLVLLLVATACWWPASRVLGVPPSLLEVTAVMLLVPLAEELYFRGAWLSILRFPLGAVGATLVVSAVFGLLHQSQGQLLPMLVASCALCALTLWTRTLLWAVMLHATWNTLALVVRLAPGAGRFAMAGSMTVVALLGIIWHFSLGNQDEL